MACLPVDPLTARLAQSMAIENMRARRCVVRRDDTLRTIMLTDASKVRVAEADRLARCVPGVVGYTYEMLLFAVKRALVTNKFDRVKKMLHAEPWLIFQCDPTGGTFLHTAARENSIELAQLTLYAVKLAAGSDERIVRDRVMTFLNIEMSGGKTALHEAAYRGCPRLKVINFLLDEVAWSAGDDLAAARDAVIKYLYKTTIDGYTALHLAIFSESIKAIEVLLEKVAKAASLVREVQIMAAYAYLGFTSGAKTAREMLEIKGLRMGEGFKLFENVEHFSKK